MHLQTRHDALIAHRQANHVQQRIQVADQKFASHVDRAQVQAEAAIQESLQRILHAGKRQFQRKLRYHSSPFSFCDNETSVETSALHDAREEHSTDDTSTKCNVIDVLHPQPTLIEKSTPIEHFLVRHATSNASGNSMQDIRNLMSVTRKNRTEQPPTDKNGTATGSTTATTIDDNDNDNNNNNDDDNDNDDKDNNTHGTPLHFDAPLTDLLQTDKELRRQEVLERRSLRLATRKKEKFAHQQKRGRKSSLLSFKSFDESSPKSSRASSLNASPRLPAKKRERRRRQQEETDEDDYALKTEDYCGRKARAKYFVDLKSYTKSDFDHIKNTTTRREKVKARKKNCLDHKKRHLQLINESNGKTQKQDEGSDQELHDETTEHDDDETTATVPNTSALSRTKWQEKRKRGHELTNSTRLLDDIQDNSWLDYRSEQAPINRHETILLPQRHREDIERQATTSLNRVEFRTIDPRHTFMKAMLDNEMLPEPLLLGKNNAMYYRNQKKNRLLPMVEPNTDGTQDGARLNATDADGLPLPSTTDMILNLTHYKVGDARIIALAPSVAATGLYSTFLLSNNRLTDVSIVPLLKHLTTNVNCINTIVVFDLSQNKIGPQSVEKIPMFLQSHLLSLVTLNLGKTMKKLSKRIKAKLLHALTNTTSATTSATTAQTNQNRTNNNTSTLQRLILNNNNLDNSDAEILSNMLTHNALPQLTELNIEWNNITSKGCSSLAHSLYKNKTLITLNLNYNTAGRAAEDFALPLLHNLTLKQLLLASNSINGRGAIVLSEYLLETEHPVDVLDINANPITSMGARAMLSVVARGVDIKTLSFFDTEYTVDEDLKKEFTPDFLPKQLKLNLSIPFQRAQATMLLRMAAEHAGFTLLRLQHAESVDSTSMEELNLVRLSLDLEATSIKEYKRIFMRMCRKNNPNMYFETIEKAWIPTSQARELLTIAHQGTEPCELMHNMIISCFDINDDGKIEWKEFFEGMSTAKSMFGPTIRRMGQQPVGVMVEKGRTHKWAVPMEGILCIDYQWVPVPLLIHNETTRCNFTKIITILNNAPPHNRLHLISLFCSDDSLNIQQALILCKMLEKHPGSALLGSTLDHLVEVIMAVTDKRMNIQVVRGLTSHTRVALRKHMRGHYRVLFGMYTGSYSIDLSLKHDRLVVEEIMAHYNLLIKNGLTAPHTHKGNDANDNTNPDTSQQQNWIHMSNIELDSASFSMEPYVLRTDHGDEDNKEGILPLPDHGILKFDLVDINGPGKDLLSLIFCHCCCTMRAWCFLCWLKLIFWCWVCCCILFSCRFLVVLQIN